MLSSTGNLNICKKNTILKTYDCSLTQTTLGLFISLTVYKKDMMQDRNCRIQNTDLIFANVFNSI